MTASAPGLRRTCRRSAPQRALGGRGRLVANRLDAAPPRRAGNLGRHQLVALLQRGQYQMVPLDAPRCRARNGSRLCAGSSGPGQLCRRPGRHRPARDSAPPAGSARPACWPWPPRRTRSNAWPSRRATRAPPLKSHRHPETALRSISSLVEPAERAQALLYVGLQPAGHHRGWRAGEARALDLTAAQVALPDDDASRQACFDRAGLELQRTWTASSASTAT